MHQDNMSKVMLDAMELECDRHQVRVRSSRGRHKCILQHTLPRERVCRSPDLHVYVLSLSVYACAMICMHAALGCSCPTDTYRIQFLLSSYRRSRIQKIQSMHMFLLADEEAFEHMSKAEQDFCTGYANMVQRFLGASMFNVFQCSKGHIKDRLNCTRARARAGVRI